MTWDSLVLSAVAATAAVLLSYPMALFLFRTPQPVARVASRDRRGAAAGVGHGAGDRLAGDPGRSRADQRRAARGRAGAGAADQQLGGTLRIGLTESVMPYATLALLAGFGRARTRAWRKLRQHWAAVPLRSFWRITLPLTRGGRSAPPGCWPLCCRFPPSSPPHLMGGGRVFVLATEIYDAATQTLDWPAAAALSVYALVLAAGAGRRQSSPVSPGARMRLTPILAGFGYAFLLAPLVIVALMSLSNEPYLTFPPQGFSVRWVCRAGPQRADACGRPYQRHPGCGGGSDRVAAGCPGGTGPIARRRAASGRGGAGGAAAAADADREAWAC